MFCVSCMLSKGVRVSVELGARERKPHVTCGIAKQTGTVGCNDTAIPREHYEGCSQTETGNNRHVSGSNYVLCDKIVAPP